MLDQKTIARKVSQPQMLPEDMQQLSKLTKEYLKYVNAAPCTGLHSPYGPGAVSITVMVEKFGVDCKQLIKSC